MVQCSFRGGGANGRFTYIIDVHSISFIRLSLFQNIEFPESMSAEMRSLLEGLLKREVPERLGCQGNGYLACPKSLVFMCA